MAFRSNNYYFAALRFFDKGQPVHAEPFSADRTPGDPTLAQPLRFGNVYLIKGNQSFIVPLRLISLSCIRGSDTMQVCFQAAKFQNLAYDSIPFRAGSYYLFTPDREIIGALPADFYVSFADYFRQHEAEVARANPFAECRFPEDTNPIPSFKKYVPPTPTEIFRLLLQYTNYERQVGYQLRPLAKGQLPTD
ncbi:hypothetical protein MUN81_11095 [Hymenobacter sp. 5317J-9]|uniref:hypothetical protein n=1 Tax=Hymenobacter sp. 5317J-9 TaxID=2932250 RepID=UPI001FD6E6B5|nr:hypothetical protein [Hymenobacter sp. 5317J-9]UOR00023.1 hypothetical protein MUN81_11095 [Hymenobacter sp. 5317J-9]